ncbi:hypothetical protein [Labrys neptuniae]
MITPRGLFFLPLLMVLILALQAADSGARAGQATASDGPRDMLAEAIKACWPGAKSLDRTVRIKLSLKSDGSLAAKPVLVLADDAPANVAAYIDLLRAIAHCAPFKGLKAFKASYRDWRDITIEIAAVMPTAPPAPPIVAAVASPAPAKTRASTESGMTAATVVAFALLFQLLSDGRFAFARWRRRREAGAPGPWQPVPAAISAQTRPRRQPLDPVSDPKNWRE